MKTIRNTQVFFFLSSTIDSNSSSERIIDDVNISSNEKNFGLFRIE